MTDLREAIRLREEQIQQLERRAIPAWCEIFDDIGAPVPEIEFICVDVDAEVVLITADGGDLHLVILKEDGEWDFRCIARYHAEPGA
jgi:hypothetical protein